MKQRAKRSFVHIGPYLGASPLQRFALIGLAATVDGLRAGSSYSPPVSLNGDVQGR